MAAQRPTSHAELVRSAGELAAGGRVGEAERILKAVLDAEPGHIVALITLGTVAGMQGRFAEAVKHLRRAARLAPSSDAAHYNLGQALIELGRHAEAIEPLQRAAALEPRSHVHEKLGDCLRQLGRLEEAARHYLRAVDLGADDGLVLSSAVEMLRKLCDWTRLPDLEARLVAAAERGQPVEPLLLLHVRDDPALQRKAAEAYWRGLVRPLAPPAKRSRPARDRLRLGYLSADFRRHPMVSVIGEVIELHDRARFEVIGLSYGPDDSSPERKRMVGAFDRLVDMRMHTGPQMVSRIADAGIDILVDLAGFTANARLGVVAARPAPVVVHYMGYPGTLGGGAYDWLIADAIVAPPGSEAGFAEALARLPRCYWALDRKRSGGAEPASRRAHGLPEEAVVLASFNGQQKLSPALLDIWARVLEAVPEAVLWLYADHEAAAASLRRESAARGIASHRLVMAGRVPPQRHLARLPLADLMLDAWPYGGHTTACDALFMGVPVVTMAGRAFASRVGASLLTHAGLPELITSSPEAYERTAVAIAGDRDRLVALRRQLAEVRPAAPLFDTAGFTRGLEAAYSEMWLRRQRGERPATFDIAST